MKRRTNNNLRVSKTTAMQRLHAGLTLLVGFAGSTLVRVAAERDGCRLRLRTATTENGNAAVRSVHVTVDMDDSVRVGSLAEAGEFVLEAPLVVQALFGRRKTVASSDKVEFRSLAPQERALELRFGRSCVVVPMHQADTTHQSVAAENTGKHTTLPLPLLAVLSDVLKKSQLALADTPNLGLQKATYSLGGRAVGPSGLDVVLYGPYACILARVVHPDVSAGELVSDGKFLNIPTDVLAAYAALTATGETVTSITFPQERNVCVVSTQNYVVTLNRRDPSIELTSADMAGFTRAAEVALAETSACTTKIPALVDALDKAGGFVDESAAVPVVTLTREGKALLVQASLRGGARSSIHVPTAAVRGKKAKPAPWSADVQVPAFPLRKCLQAIVHEVGEQGVKLNVDEGALFLEWSSDEESPATVVTGYLVGMRLVR